MLIAFLAFHEQVTWNMMLGAVVIISGVYLVVTADE
jgi:drug/metabolite transporter (DMT)-like permease